MGNHVQSACLISQAKTGLLTLSPCGATLCYKSDQYRVNSIWKNKTAL